VVCSQAVRVVVSRWEGRWLMMAEWGYGEMECQLVKEGSIVVLGMRCLSTCEGQGGS
jgi:hypothetical protein